MICRYVEGVDLIKPRKPYESISQPMSADRYEKFLAILFTLFKIYCYVNGLHDLNSTVEIAFIFYTIYTRYVLSGLLELEYKNKQLHNFRN